MQSVEKRQEKLKYLGYYKGIINGVENKETKKAYRELQEDYFTRDKDKDGVYGNDTENLLNTVYNVEKYSKNFTPAEFKCDCGAKYCTAYPAIVNAQLVKNLQKVRNKFGAVTITSGMRCKTSNARMTGSIPTSRHLEGRAADIYIAGLTGTLAGRRKVMKYWKTLPKYNYTYCNENGSAPNMGNAVHVDID